MRKPGSVFPAFRGALLAASFLLLLPSIARADGIGFDYLITFGVGVLVPVLAFVTVVEAWTMGRVLRTPCRDLWRTSMRANIWSGIAGFPVSLGNSLLASLLLPDDLHGYFARLPWVSLVGYVDQFLVTVAVEAAWWRRAPAVRAQPRARWRAGVVLANLATYLVLAPLHYLRSRPTVQGVASFEPTTEWAAQPATDIYFVRETDRHLMRVRSDGRDLVELTKEPVADYRISGDDGLLLVKRDADSEPRRLRLEATGAVAEPDGPPSGPLLQPLYGPTDTQEDQLGAVKARVELGLGSDITVRDDGHDEIHFATNPGFWFPFASRWMVRPCILANGREILFVWGSGIYLLDLDSRRVGRVVSDVPGQSGSPYTVIQNSFAAKTL